MPPPPSNALNWAELMPEVEKIARQVGRRKNASPRVRDELNDLATSFVYEKSGHYNPAVATFGAWCRTVLGNKCVDLIQKEAADRRLVEGVGERLAETTRGGEGDSDGPDIADVNWCDLYQGRLRPIDRILMILDLEQCSRCPPATMVSWIHDATLPADFPMRELEAVPEHRRNEAIARALLQAAGREMTAAAVAAKKNWIRTRLFRAKVIIRNHLWLGD